MTRDEFYASYEGIAATAAGRSTDLAKRSLQRANYGLWRMRILEAAYDAVLDQAVPELMQEYPEVSQRSPLSLKLQMHARFADRIADIVDGNLRRRWQAEDAGEKWNKGMDDKIDLDPALAKYQEEFQRVANAIARVNWSPVPVYSAAIRRKYPAPDQAPAGSPMDQPVHFSSPAGVVRTLSARKVTDHMSEFRGASSMDGDKGEYAGHFHALTMYSRTAGIFALNDWLKATDQEPLSVGECCRIRDLAVRSNPRILGMDDVYAAYDSVRPRHEGDPARDPAEFRDWAVQNERAFDSPAALQRAADALRSGGDPMSGRGGRLYVDLFGPGTDGVRPVDSSWGHAFLNDDVTAQARIMGKIPAVAKNANGQRYYVSATDAGTGVNDEDAYDREMCRHFGYDALPVADSRDGELPPWRDARAGLLDLGNGSVSHEAPAWGPMDRLGLSAFRPYLKKEVYEAFEAQVGQGQVAETVVPREHVRAGLAVIQELERRGLDYEVRLDESRGQLAAVVEEPVAVQFRILDTKNPEFIGRAYYSYTNVITRFNYDGPKVQGKGTAVVPDEEMARDLVAYALGETVPIRHAEGQKVLVDGQPADIAGMPGRKIELVAQGRTIEARRTAGRGQWPLYNATFAMAGGEGTNALYRVDLRQGPVSPAGGRMMIAAPVRINTQRGKNADAYRPYAGPDEAFQVLRDASGAARDYVREQADLVLRAEAEMDFGDAEDPEKVRKALAELPLSEDPYIRSVQQACVDALCGEGTAADREGAAITALNSELDALANLDGTEPSLDFSNVVRYSGAREATLLRALSECQGIYGVKPVSRNEEATMGRVIERTVRFDPSTATDLLTGENGEFWDHVAGTVRDSLISHGVRIESMEVDANGIIRYTGNRDWNETMAAMEKATSDEKNRQDFSRVEGTIGQIFAPDARGVVVTKFAQGGNYAMVPGYMATVTRGEGSVESRTLCKGYSQVLDQKIRAELHQSLSCCSEGDPLNTSRLNRVYRHLYDERYPEDYEAWFKSLGMSEAFMQATIDTQKGAIRYDKRFIEESTLNARVRALQQNIVDDRNADGYSVTGRDLSVLGWSEDGYFDDSATQTSVGQGISRYLVSGAHVDKDGRIVKSEIPNDKCPILALPEMHNLHFNPPDRRTMVFSNAMHCFGISEPAKSAHMTLQGWTMDDAFVISKAFAAAHMVPGEDGEPRPMRIGDKICDLNGNKGVVSLVVDPAMDLTVAEEKGIGGPVALFAANPGLEVVGSPFTAPSRMNGGTARGMMESPKDLRLPDGTVVPGAIGSIPYIITDKTVDEKTHVYDDEDLAAGKGRSISSQLLWSLQARNAGELVKEFFAPNAPNMRVIREKLIAMGMDLDEDYTIVNGYAPHRMPDGTPERRPILDLPAPDLSLTAAYNEARSISDEADRKDAVKELRGDLTTESRQAKADAVEMVSRTGGFLRLPFPLTMANGMETAKAPDGEGWLLPVMPLSQRSQQAYDDDTAIYHDFTQAYRTIAEQAVMYRFEEARPSQNVATHDANMAGTRARAQEAYDRMAKEIRETSFDNKWNDWKKRAMSRKMGQSVTAVGTPDPRLSLCEVAMPGSMLNHLGIKEGERVLLWRDPQLRPEGTAYMRAVRNDELQGIAINPAMDKRFDGDFDGDTWGAVSVKGQRAKAEAMRLFAPEHSMVDLGPTPDYRTPDNIVLALNEGLDIASSKAVSKGTEADAQMAAAREEALAALANGQDMTGFELLDRYVQERIRGSMGTTTIRYGSMADHLDSVREMIDSGAKGKVSGLMEYVKWLGVDADITPGENGAPTTVNVVRDYGAPGIYDEPGSPRREELRNMNTQVNMATAIKNFGTPLAGAVSQKNVGLCRHLAKDSIGDSNLRYALEVTYGATQGVLQAKHDAKEALQKYRILTDVIPALYTGNAIAMGPDGTWQAVEGPDGPVWNGKKDFIDQYTALCNSKTGLNFNVARDNIERLAACLYDGNENSFGYESIRRAKDKGLTEISTIDHLAYAGPSFDTVRALAGRQLFDTDMTRQFAPKEHGTDQLASLATRKGAFQERASYVEERILMGREAEAARAQAVLETPPAERAAEAEAAAEARATRSPRQADMSGSTERVLASASEMECETVGAGIGFGDS